MPRKLRKNIRKRKGALKHPIVKLTPQQQLQQQMMNDPTMLQQMSSNPMLLNRVIGAQSGGLRAALLAKMAGYGGAADGTAYNPQSQMNLSSLKNQITDVKKSNIDIQKQISENEKKLEYDRHTKKLNELNVEKKKKEEQLKELSTEEYAKKVSEKAAEVAKMEQDVINLKNHTTQYKVLKDEEIKQKALKTYMDSDEYKNEVEANVKAEKLLQLQNQTVQYENLAQESKNNDEAMQKAMKSSEYIKANNDWLDAQANAKAAQLIGSIRTKIQADEDSSNEALMNADFKNAFEALHSKVKLVNDFSSGKKLKSEGFDKELKEVAQNMTKITDAATRQAVQSAYDAVRATVVESQEKELQQTKTDLVNAFLKTKSQVGHYAADGTYVPAGGTYIPAGGTYIPAGGTYILASGTYIPPNSPREAPAPGLPKTFTSSHGHRHRHAPKPTQQPTVQNPAPQPTVQNPAPQPKPAQQPTVQNPAPQPKPAQQPPPQPAPQPKPAQQPPPQPAQQPPPQPAQQPPPQPAPQQPQTEQGHKRSREKGNQEFLKMLKENYSYPDTLDFSDRYKEAIRKFKEGNTDPNLFSFMVQHQMGYNFKPGKYKLAKGYDLIAYHPNDMDEFTPRYLVSELNDNSTLFMKRVKNRDGTKEERVMNADDLEREFVKNGLGIYEMPADEVQETQQEEVQIQPDMEEIVQQQQLEEPEGNEQVPPLETNFTELDEDLEQPKNLDPQQVYAENMESFQESKKNSADIVEEYRKMFTDIQKTPTSDENIQHRMEVLKENVRKYNNPFYLRPYNVQSLAELGENKRLNFNKTYRNETLFKVHSEPNQYGNKPTFVSADYGTTMKWGHKANPDRWFINLQPQFQEVVDAMEVNSEPDITGIFSAALMPLKDMKDADILDQYEMNMAEGNITPDVLEHLSQRTTQNHRDGIFGEEFRKKVREREGREPIVHDLANESLQNVIKTYFADNELRRDEYLRKLKWTVPNEMLVLKNMFLDKIKPTTEINDARLKHWVKAFPFTKDIIGNMERKPEWLQKHIFGNELIPYGQAIFEELEPETQERVMQTIREDSNTNYDKIFLGYRLPEMGDQSPKAKGTWEIYNILGEHEAKMQQLEAEGKLPKATPKKKSRTK
ncbi:hypothetical protein TVAG_159620 [Trichomonas vaginalis G3]|uniref:Uncharacterized protein n=1 Tax=Trichomonas vaginalis (strain ATCC PRA-98 / G3) TaxID=412133 RepID=A2DUQ4_TRIV3|nr:hypothetical protein TVAG_159620 [Trichomonas vaginalis G3]|eukprot:XP_001328012.1 hypothetical protein [Trichomonas vaginalis G3]